MGAACSRQQAGQPLWVDMGHGPTRPLLLAERLDRKKDCDDGRWDGTTTADPCCPNPLVAGLVVVAPSLAPGEAGYLAMYYPLPGVRMPTPGYDTYLSRCHSPVPHTTTVVCDRSLCVHMWQCAVARCEFKSMPV
jgi:hypothetical protein